MEVLIRIKNKTFPLDWIETIIPGKQIAILRSKEIGSKSSFGACSQIGDFISVEVEDPEQFRMIKFELVRRVKKEPRIYDRVMIWEAYNKDGCFCLKKYDKLIESRKTHQEKRNEKKQELFLDNLLEENGLKYRREA